MHLPNESKNSKEEKNIYRKEKAEGAAIMEFSLITTFWDCLIV